MKHSIIRQKTYLPVLFVMTFVSICLAATYNTAGSGLWSNNATRSTNRPASWSNHTVNLNINSATIIS